MFSSEKARELRDAFWDANLSAADNIDSLVAFNDIKVVYWDFPNVISGTLHWIGDCCFMGINQNYIPEHILFTKAHELGHFFLHPQSSYCCNFKNTYKLERQANWFASELLMPRKLITKLSQNKTFPELKTYFEVSSTALAYRLKNLRLYDQVVKSTR